MEFQKEVKEEYTTKIDYKSIFILLLFIWNITLTYNVVDMTPEFKQKLSTSFSIISNTLFDTDTNYKVIVQETYELNTTKDKNDSVKIK